MAVIRTETKGEFAGWQYWDVPETFDEHAGPFYFRVDDDGTPRAAFRAQQKHLNAGGILHGGCMMTFADVSLFHIAYQEMEGRSGVTVQLDSTFVGPGQKGDLIEATGQVVRAGGSLVFARGQITSGERTLLTFSGIIRKLKIPAA